MTPKSSWKPYAFSILCTTQRRASRWRKGDQSRGSRGPEQQHQRQCRAHSSTSPRRPLSLRDGPKPDDPLNLTHSHGQKSNLVWPNKKNMDVNPFYCYFASVISKGEELGGVHSDIYRIYLRFMAWLSGDLYHHQTTQFTGTFTSLHAIQFKYYILF